MTLRFASRFIVVLAIANVALALGVWAVLGGSAAMPGSRPTAQPASAVKRLAEMYATSAFRAVITNDYAALNAIIKQSLSWPEIAYVSIEDAQGRIVAHTDPTRVGTSWNERVAAQIRATVKVPFQEVAVPLSESGSDGRGTVAGRVRLGYVVEPGTVTPTASPAALPMLPLWAILLLAIVAAIPVGLVAARLAMRPDRRRGTTLLLEVARLTDEVTRARADHDRQAEELKPLRDAIEQQVARIDEFARTSAEHLALVESLQRQPGERTSEVVEGTRELADLRSQLSERVAEVAGLKSQLDERMSELAELKSRATRPPLVRESRESEQALERLQRQAIPYIARVFRTSLTTILGFSKLLLQGTDGGLNEAQTTATQSIERAGARLLRFVNSLTEWGRVEAGTADLASETFDVTGVLREIASAPGLAETMRLKVEDRGEALMVRFDRQRAVQIVHALIDPGAVLHGNGAVHVSAWADMTGVHVAVAHPKRSVRKEQLPTLFEPFPPLDSRGPVETDGGRLRLALARSMAGRGGGDLGAEAHPGGGVTFTLTLPTDAGGESEPDGRRRAGQKAQR